jgi:hypothetical protein
MSGCVQVFGRWNDEAFGGVSWPASKKRQGTKSRDVMRAEGAAGAMGILPRAANAIILPAEGNRAVVGCIEAAVRDGDAMGVTGEIAQHLLGPGERRLATSAESRQLRNPFCATSALASFHTAWTLKLNSGSFTHARGKTPARPLGVRKVPDTRSGRFLSPSSRDRLTGSGEFSASGDQNCG